MKRRSFLKQTAIGTAALTVFGKGHTSDEGPVRIAVVQQDGNPGQVDINRRKALEVAEKALDQHAEIILFHEELLIGYQKDLHAITKPENGQTTKE